MKKLISSKHYIGACMSNSDYVYLLQVVNPNGTQFYYTFENDFSIDPVKSSIFLSVDHLEGSLPLFRPFIPKCFEINAVRLSVEDFNKMCDISPFDSKYKIPIKEEF